MLYNVLFSTICANSNESEHPMSSIAKSQSLGILVVEGYLSQSKSIMSYLDDFDNSLSVISTQDGEETLPLLEKQSVSLLIVDVHLKGKMDGYDLCKAIRSSSVYSQVPIILLLGGHLSLERSKGISAGADLLLHRPVVKEELFRMVQLLLQLSVHQSKSQSQQIRWLHSVS